MLRLSIAAVFLASALAAGAQKIERQYPRFFPGARWEVRYGAYQGVEKFAVNELQARVQTSFPYVLSVQPVGQFKPAEAEHLILVGTRRNNPLLDELVKRGVLKDPAAPESFRIGCFNSPWSKVHRVIAVCGHDPNGVLYGVEELNSQTLGRPHNQAQFDGIEDFVWSARPAIQSRGVWCWGYVIYDYKRFFDHMARLKMNTIIFWNDVPPQNCREVIEYAHSRGIRVILGFEWGWGINDLDPSSTAQRERTKRAVLQNFRDNYRSLGMDGMYFQTFTENDNLKIGDKTTAQWAGEWVNDISRALLKLEPHLRIEFGLHASSIRSNYTDLKDLDPRVTITWEDAGSLPFSYDPVIPDPKNAASQDPYLSLDATIDYAKRLATFRPNQEFDMVAKGWIQLPWQTSEHHGQYILGERDKTWITDRLRQRQSRWDFVNDLWSKNYPSAAKFYRDVLATGVPRIAVTGLVEDGMFEERIQSSVAIFAETLWNPYAFDADILRRASSPYYSLP